MSSPFRSSVAVFTATCLFLASTASLAQDGRKARIAVVDVKGNADPDSTDILYFVEKGLRTSSAPVELETTDGVLNAGQQQNAAQNLAFGRDALNAARGAFKSGDCDAASDSASQAVLYYEQAFAYLDSPDDYLAALSLQGVCLARSGAHQAAIDVLSRAFVVNPKLDYSAYPKDKKVFEVARSRVLDRDLTSVTVVAIPDGSRVFVDGRYRGVSPAYRPGLREGGHFVRVERQGYARSGVRVDTSTEPDVKVEVRLKPAARKKALDNLLEDLEREMAREDLPATSATLRLKSLLLVDYVVLMRATGTSGKKQLDLALFDLTTGRRLNVVQGITDWGRRSRDAKNAVISLVQSLVAVDLDSKVAIGGGPAVSGDSGGGIATKWWFWTIIGVAVAGTAVGLALGLQPDEQEPAIPSDGNGALILSF